MFIPDLETVIVHIKSNNIYFIALNSQSPFVSEILILILFVLLFWTLYFIDFLYFPGWWRQPILLLFVWNIFFFFQNIKPWILNLDMKLFSFLGLLFKIFFFLFSNNFTECFVCACECVYVWFLFFFTFVLLRFVIFSTNYM